MNQRTAKRRLHKLITDRAKLKELMDELESQIKSMNDEVKEALETLGEKSYKEDEVGALVWTKYDASKFDKKGFIDDLVEKYGGRAIKPMVKKRTSTAPVEYIQFRKAG